MTQKGNKYRSDKKKNKSGEESPALSKLLQKIQFTGNERGKKVFGLALLMISVFLFISFTSYFFTWRADHDKIMGSLWELFSDPDIEVDNWLGKSGALVAHVMIAKWFGISAYVFALFSFLFGVKILFGNYILPIGKTFRYAFFSFFFLAATLGYLLSNSGEMLYLAGNFGYELNRWMRSILGSAGAGIFIFFSAFAFVVHTFNISFFIPAFLKGNNETATEDDELATVTAGESDNSGFSDSLPETMNEEEQTDAGDLLVAVIENEASSNEFELEAENEDQDEDRSGSEEPTLDLEIEETEEDPVAD
jgi:S-DNA-T family DNA segregation ATPase FtsK/SpoIIIE